LDLYFLLAHLCTFYLIVLVNCKRSVLSVQSLRENLPLHFRSLLLLLRTDLTARSKLEDALRLEHILITRGKWHLPRDD
jgi:hypothetical protein